MWVYLVRRLLLIIPTVVLITIISFLVMRNSPGDPLQLQMGQEESMKEGSVTRDAYKIMRKQFNLDKPVILNFETYKDYTAEIDFALEILSKTKAEITVQLDNISKVQNFQEDNFYKNIQSFDINNFDKRLKNDDARKNLSGSILIGAQLKIESIGRWAVCYLIKKLSEEKELKKNTVIIDALNLVVDESFKYVLPSNATNDDINSVKQTWKVWNDRKGKTIQEYDGKMLNDLDEAYGRLKSEFKVSNDIRDKIWDELQKLSTQEKFSRFAPYFYRKLSESQNSDDINIATSCLLETADRLVMKIENKKEEDVNNISANWIAWYEIKRDYYEPSFLKKITLIFSETQYFSFAINLVTFNFGRSMVGTRELVSIKLWEALKVSLPMMLLAELIVYLLAVPSGILCAVTRGRWPDKLTSFGLFILYSVPSFWAALMIQAFLCSSKYFNIFPLMGLHSDGYEEFTFIQRFMDYLFHIAMPVLCLSIFHLAALAMYSRTSMLDAINQDYIRTARAKGLSERKVIFKHALRNSLIPIITLFAGFIPGLLGGSIIVESIFHVPGMGRLSVESIFNKDFTTLMAIVYINAIVVMISILISDILYALVDPRITFSKLESA